jgi:hypothetical protein
LLLEDETRLAIGAYFDVYNELAGYPEFVLRRALAIAMEDVGLKIRQR